MKEGKLRREGKKSGREGGRDLLFFVNYEIFQAGSMYASYFI